MTAGDIEIYVRDAPIPAIQAWVGSVFGPAQWQRRGSAICTRIPRGQGDLPIKLFPEAFRGFCCILFESADTPWTDDLECARDARQALGGEVRCTVGGWSEEDDPEDEWWWRLDDRGEQKVRWN